MEAASAKSSLFDGEFVFSVSMAAARGQMSSSVQLQESTDPAIGKTIHIPFDVGVVGAAGGQIGSHTMRLRVQVVDEVPHQIGNLRVLPFDAISPQRFSFSVEIHDDGTGKLLAAGQQLFRLPLEGDFLPYTTPSTPAPAIFSQSLWLSAASSTVGDRSCSG